MDINNITNDTELTLEEGYELTKFYVHYFWITNKYYSLKNRYEEEDVVNEVYLKFLRLNHFAKYNPFITSKKYHIMNGVRTSMIDLLRKQREEISLDQEVDDGFSLMETIEDEGLTTEKRSLGFQRREEILEQLPLETRSKIKGYSPLFHREVNISYRVLALHLEAGYSVKQIAQIYKNPRTGESISEASVSKYIGDLREYVLDNVMLV